MKAQHANKDQQFVALKAFCLGMKKSQIQWQLNDSFGSNAVSSRTLSYWISDFKKLDTAEISREAPFELHRIEEYGLPLNSAEIITEIAWILTESPYLLTGAKPRKDWINFKSISVDWKPTVREAEWWWRIHNMVPDFNLPDVHLVATQYVIKELLQLITQIPANYTDLNGFLTYKPWQSLSRTDHYKEAIKSGRFNEVGKPWDESLSGDGEAVDDLPIDMWMSGEILIWSQPERGKYLTPAKGLVRQSRLSAPPEYHFIPHWDALINAWFTKEELEAFNKELEETQKGGGK